ncbi:MAG: hypothetical protein K0R51_734 [Cytophagaceae bacterium]|jgi:uncharacterized protein YdeI (YjbR/CyaY-like superfamily)|nr:hypothetical protein [Cytophagaceae bacterium]
MKKNTIKKEEIESFAPSSRKQWRTWLQKNHAKKEAVWLICHKKESEKPSIPWTDLVDEALCFGWIDSKRKTIDKETFIQFFSKRKPKGTWSKINKDKIQPLIDQGLMTEAGLSAIEAAKKNGSWIILDQVETLEIPKDLMNAFKAYPGSKAFFMSLSKSVRKAMLQWIAFAKREETRKKRIQEIASLAAQQKKPKQF